MIRAYKKFGVMILLCSILIGLGGSSSPVNGQSSGDGELIIPQNLVPITPENADQLQPIARLGRGTIQNFQWINDGEQLGIVGRFGVRVFDTNHWNEAVMERAYPDTLADDLLLMRDARMSPNGRSIIIQLHEQAVYWDLVTQQDFVVLSEAPQAAIGFSPDGRVAFATETFSVILRDPLSGEETEFIGHNGYISTLEMSQDGLLMATGSDDGTARVWNVQTGNEVARFSLQGLPIRDVAFSSDDNLLAISEGTPITPNQGYAYPTVHDVSVFDLITNESIALFTVHGRTISRLAFLENDGLLLAGQSVYDLETQEEVDYSENLPETNRVKASPNGQYLAIYLFGGLRILNSEDYTVEANLPFYGFVRNVDFSPDGRLMMWQAGYSTSVIQLDTGIEVAAIEGALGHSFIQSGELVLLTSDGKVVWWNPDTENIERELQASNFRVSSISFSEDESQFVTNSTGREIKVWDSTTLEPLFSHHFDEPLSGRTRVHLSVDGRYVIAEDAFLYSVWDVETGTLIAAKEEVGMEFGINDAGTHLAWQANNSDVVTLQNLITGEVLRTYPIIAAAVDFVQGDQMLSISSSIFSGGDGMVYLFDVETGQEITTFPFEGQPTIANFSPDGNLVTIYGDYEDTSGNGIKLEMWDYQTGYSLYSVTGITGAHITVYNQDQSLFLTGVGTTSAHMINTATGEEIMELEGQAGGADKYSFSPDETFIITTHGNSAWLWGILN